MMAAIQVHSVLDQKKRHQVDENDALQVIYNTFPICIIPAPVADTF